MKIVVEFQHETDGRWSAEVPSIPGVLASGASKGEVEARILEQVMAHCSAAAAPARRKRGAGSVRADGRDAGGMAGAA